MHESGGVRSLISLRVPRFRAFLRVLWSLRNQLMSFCAFVFDNDHEIQLVVQA